MAWRQASVPKAMMYSCLERWMVWARVWERLEGAGGAGLNVAADDGGQEAAEGGAEIAGGKVLAGEEIGQFAGEFIGGAGLGVFVGVVGAEVGMMGGAGSAALAAVGKGETTQGLAVLWAKRGHRWLQKLSWE